VPGLLAAEAYLKDHDDTPASGAKTHVVDSSSSTLDAPGLAPHQDGAKHEPPPSSSGAQTQVGGTGASGRRGLHTSAAARAEKTAGEVFKDVAGPGGAEGAGEHASGPFHRAGPGDNDYQTVSKSSP
jgi:hypothetical protein